MFASRTVDVGNKNLSTFQIVDLDAKRNRNREALNTLKNEMSDSGECPSMTGCLFSTVITVSLYYLTSQMHFCNSSNCHCTWSNADNSHHFQRKWRFALETCSSNLQNWRQERWFRKVKQNKTKILPFKMSHSVLPSVLGIREMQTYLLSTYWCEGGTVIQFNSVQGWREKQG